MTNDIQKYNAAQTGENILICKRLMEIIAKELPKAESKVWHAHPVWFIEGNPIVGYHKLKDCIRVLFWSGRSFKTKGLSPEGSFKAAEKRYASADDIKVTELRGWLREAKSVQWDYKNIIKRKGKLVRL